MSLSAPTSFLMAWPWATRIASTCWRGQSTAESCHVQPDLLAPPREAYTTLHTDMPARVPARKAGSGRGVMPSR